VSFVQDTIEGNINELMYLVGKVHRVDEDPQRYITERIYVDRNSGHIVGKRVLLLKGGRKHKALDPSPIHIRVIAK